MLQRSSTPGAAAVRSAGWTPRRDVYGDGRLDLIRARQPETERGVQDLAPFANRLGAVRGLPARYRVSRSAVSGGPQTAYDAGRPCIGRGPPHSGRMHLRSGWRPGSRRGPRPGGRSGIRPPSPRSTGTTRGPLRRPPPRPLPKSVDLEPRDQRSRWRTPRRLQA